VMIENFATKKYDFGSESRTIEIIQS